jgi:hypothetical protein
MQTKSRKPGTPKQRLAGRLPDGFPSGGEGSANFVPRFRRLTAGDPAWPLWFAKCIWNGRDGLSRGITNCLRRCMLAAGRRQHAGFQDPCGGLGIWALPERLSGERQHRLVRRVAPACRIRRKTRTGRLGGSRGRSGSVERPGAAHRLEAGANANTGYRRRGSSRGRDGRCFPAGRRFGPLGSIAVTCGTWFNRRTRRSGCRHAGAERCATRSRSWREPGEYRHNGSGCLWRSPDRPSANAAGDDGFLSGKSHFAHAGFRRGRAPGRRPRTERRPGTRVYSPLVVCRTRAAHRRGRCRRHARFRYSRPHSAARQWARGSPEAGEPPPAGRDRRAGGHRDYPGECIWQTRSSAGRCTSSIEDIVRQHSQRTAGCTPGGAR